MTPVLPVPRISICIASWNTRELLRDCLTSIYADPESTAWEVLVVDNGSEDGSPAMVAEGFPRVRLSALTANLGFVGGTNLALSQARGRYLVLLNSDTQVEPGALGAVASFLDGNPAAGAAGPCLITPSGGLQLSCGRAPGPGWEIVNKLLLHKILPVHRFGRWDHAEAREVGWVTGACLMARREVVEQVGPLDPAIFMFYEDLEWCLRLRRSGWQVWYCPAGRVVHLGGQSTRKDFTRMLVISQGSQYYLYRKHFGRSSLHLLRLLTVVEVILRTLLWGPVAVIRCSRRTEARQRLAAYGQILRRTLVDRTFWDPAGCTPRTDS